MITNSCNEYDEVGIQIEENITRGEISLVALICPSVHPSVCPSVRPTVRLLTFVDIYPIRNEIMESQMNSRL